jgi:hypothetical protein
LHQKQSILGETKGGRHEKEKKREGVKDRRRKTQRTRERIGEQGEKKKTERTWENRGAKKNRRRREKETERAGRKRKWIQSEEQKNTQTWRMHMRIQEKKDKREQGGERPKNQ